MILYDKSGVFLGMGSQELYFLGYEDMEEFKNYHNDFADLFINKPGFIFKFKNFSWIDYALHSGTPNKKVLIRTKSGKEVETLLGINEIFLNKEINGSPLFFCIELTNNFINNNVTNFTKQEAPQETQEAITAPAQNKEIVIEDAPMIMQSVVFQDDTSPYESDYIQPSTNAENLLEETTTPPPIKNDITYLKQDNSPDFKLKFDNDIFEAPVEQPSTLTHKDYSSIDEIKIDDLNFALQDESYPEDKQEDLRQDTNLFVDSIKQSPPKDECFDLLASAEELGLDLVMLAQIIGEYIDEIDEKLSSIEQYIHEDKREMAKDEIAKLNSVAQNLRIVSLEQAFEYLQKSLSFDTKEEIEHTLINVNQVISQFKESMQ